MAKCAVQECGAEAQCVPALLIYPHKSIMAHYGSSEPLTRMLINLPVCERCLEELNFKALIDQQTFLTLTGFLEKQSGCTVDVEATKVARCEFTDPEYLHLLRCRSEKDAAAALTAANDQVAA